jgi:hypothetical protein
VHPPQHVTQSFAPFWEYVTAPHHVSVLAKFSDVISELPSERLPTSFEVVLLSHVSATPNASLNELASSRQFILLVFLRGSGLLQFLARAISSCDACQSR